MKRGKRFTTLAVALALVCGLVIGANAAGTSQKIQAYLTPGRAVKYNGEVQAMTDANGNTVYPISYNGTTYLPIRAVSGMLGVGVVWDGDTQSVLLGDSGDGTDLIETFTPYVRYDQTYPSSSGRPLFIQNADKKSENIGGETVSHWIGLNITSSRTESQPCSFNLGGRYETLTFKAYSDKDATLVVKGDDGSVLDSFSLKGEQVPQTFTVNLRSTTQLSFEFDRVTSETYNLAHNGYVYIFSTALK